MPFSIKKKNKFIFYISVLLLIFVIWQVSVAASVRPVESENLHAVSDGQIDATTLLLEPKSWLPVFRRVDPIHSSGTGPIYGVNFISSAENLADETQFQNGLSTGATWNRWPIYWPRVETSSGNFDWTTQDAAVRGDVEHGLKTNAILLGTPGFYTTSSPIRSEVTRPARRGMIEILATQAAAPVGLYEPVFTDGTDNPGNNKQINPGNKWAHFTQLAVNRYKPGGLLSQQHGWAINQGVTHWEMWNEPDLIWFWDSSLQDYARLLKVGYLAAKHADPNATVLFAGLANNFEKPNYLRDVLEIFSRDPLASQNNFFHDILATHSYFYSWQSWKHVYDAGQTMNDFGIDKPIWLNETGVPAWNDYPGPVWDPNSPLRATMAEQADFVIQTAFYATFAGADAIFHFQLYDACGNQPEGTDFPPHDGGLCNNDPNSLCAGDANGLFRNPPDAACFTKHPNPESKRPNFDAFKVLTTYFNGVEPLWRLRPGGSTQFNGPQELIAYYRPASNEIIIGMWSRNGETHLAEIPASSSSATLHYPDGTSRIITPDNGQYQISLPAATNQNANWDSSLYPIGGRPVIFSETDQLAPVVIGEASFGPGGIELTWSGDDNLGSGIESYEVTVSVDGGPPRPWLNSRESGPAMFRSQSGESYQFWITARDRAGNVSSPHLIVPDDPGEASTS